MRRAFLVLAVLGVVGCGGEEADPRNTGPTFGTVCWSDACSYPAGDGYVMVYSYNGAEVARCSWVGPGSPETCLLSSEPAREIPARDLVACRGDGPRRPCP